MENESLKKKLEKVCTVSSNSLFNFMPKYEYLKMAIEEGFWPRYNLETNWEGKTFAIPMLSFCDIPLSLVKNHIDKYGNYGIGVNKSFVRKNKMTPALYLSNESRLMYKLRTILRDFSSPTTIQKNLSVKEQLLYYVKKVSGKEGNTIGNYKFYDEREWRYIPPIDDNVHLEIVDKSCNKNSLISLNEKTIEKKITISANDINYIIVSKDSEIKDVIEVIRKNASFSKDINRICSRIITIEQIKNDF